MIAMTPYLAALIAAIYRRRVREELLPAAHGRPSPPSSAVLANARG
jgi:hypothetical protein